MYSDPKKLLKEHKHLVKVLRSGSKKDDLVEAKKQGKEIKEYREAMKKEGFVYSFTKVALFEGLFGVEATSVPKPPPPPPPPPKNVGKITMDPNAAASAQASMRKAFGM